MLYCDQCGKHYDKDKVSVEVTENSFPLEEFHQCPVHGVDLRGTTLQEMLDELPPERREKVEERAKELLEELKEGREEK